MTVRFYSSIAQPTTLALNMTAASTVMEVAASIGYPASTPFTVAVDYGTSLEELVQVDSTAGTTWTVTRAIGGTSAQDHSSGAAVRHVAYSQDFADSRTHENSSAGVHGVTGDIVGTTGAQTLEDKTLTGAIINNSTGSVVTINDLTADAIGPGVVPFTITTDAAPNVGVHAMEVFGTGGSRKTFISKDGEINTQVNNGSPGVVLQAVVAADPNEDALQVINETAATTLALGVDGRMTILPSEDSGGIYIFPPSATWAGLPFYYERNGITGAIMNADGDFEIDGDFAANNFYATGWVNWAPTWTAAGGGLVVGNGSVGGRYARFGRLIAVEGFIIRGTTTGFGTGDVGCNLPFNAVHTGSHQWHFTSQCYDASTNSPYVTNGVAFDNGGGTSRVDFYSFKAGVAARVSGSGAQPFTWAGNTNASIRFSGTYEMA